jgi:hypothetical protein
LSFTVFFTLLEITNKMIKQRLVKNREIKIIKQFQTGCRLVQCFKYCVYRYITKYCQTEVWYSYCNRFYKIYNCTNNKEKTIYTNCINRELRFKDYKVWSKSCLVCKKVREDLVICFCNRLTIYL